MVVGSCYGTRNRPHRISITSKRDTESQGIFIVFAIEESNDRLWHCALTATVKTVCWTNRVTGSIHVIIECLCYVSTYFFLGVSCACQEDCRRSCLSTFYSFRMVVGNLCGLLRDLQGLFQCREGKANSSNSHSSSIAPGFIGLRIVRVQPLRKHIAVGSHRMRVFVSPSLHTGDQPFLRQLFVVQNPICYGYGHDGIIRIVHSAVLKNDVRALVWTKLIDATCNVSKNCACQQRIIVVQ